MFGITVFANVCDRLSGYRIVPDFRYFYTWTNKEVVSCNYFCVRLLNIKATFKILKPPLKGGIDTFKGPINVQIMLISSFFFIANLLCCHTSAGSNKKNSTLFHSIPCFVSRKMWSFQTSDRLLQ